MFIKQDDGTATIVEIGAGGGGGGGLFSSSNIIELMKFVTNFNIENILKKEYVITALKIIYKDTDKYKFIKIIEDKLIDTIIKLDKNKVKIKGHTKDDCNII